MRKYKGLFVSVFMTAALAAAGMAVSAEQTETTEAVTEAAEEVTGAAEAAEAETNEDGVLLSDIATLENYAEQSIAMLVGMTQDQIDSYIHPTSILSTADPVMVESLTSWVTAKESLGDFVAVKAHEVEIDEDEITIVSTCDFAEGEGTVTMTLDRDELSMQSMLFGTAEQSLGEKMTEAVLNTIMGVCIVFLMLLFLTWLISQFKHISKLEEGFKKKNAAPAPVPAAPIQTAAPVVEEEEVDDGELIAVIAAAIAAAEGTSADGFVVRSIKKRNRNKWQRA